MVCGGRRKGNVAKSYYSSKKRRKELERKQKQEQKRQRKFNKNAEEPEALQESTQNEDNKSSNTGSI
jgi:hypothetical protein